MNPRLILFAVIICLCLSSLTVPAQIPSQPQAKDTNKQPLPQDDSLYHQLVVRVKGGDMNVDFAQLRDSFAQWVCNDKVNTDAPNREAMVEAFEKNDNTKAVELVEVVLDYEFVHLGLHRAAEDAYRALGIQSKADFHKNVAEKLLKALMTSGDGLTPESAYRVLTIQEEYFIMDQMNYAVRGQALVSKKDRIYDVLYGEDKKTGKDVSLYFDISNFFGGCSRVKEKKQD